jgi:hypothetical protein
MFVALAGSKCRIHTRGVLEAEVPIQTITELHDTGPRAKYTRNILKRERFILSSYGTSRTRIVAGGLAGCVAKVQVVGDGGR